MDNSKHGFLKLGVSEPLIQALLKERIETPTPIQAAAIPKILAGADIIATAPTGTGKTLAYLLGILQRMEGNFAETVIVTPTPELAMQIARVAGNLAKDAGLSFKSLGLVHGANPRRQTEKLKKEKPAILVGTPQRLREMITKYGALKPVNTRFLVLDEFDLLLSPQHQDDTVSFIKLLDVSNLQILAFSATSTTRAKEQLSFLKDFQRVDISPASLSEKGAQRTAASHFYVVAPFREKLSKLKQLTHRLPINRGLVFMAERSALDRALPKLAYEQIKVGILSARDENLARKHVLDAFNRGKLTLLLATDLAARGLDFANVDTVINMGVPDTKSVYLHRAGRTARQGAAGRVVTIADPKELTRLMELYGKLGIAPHNLGGRNGH